MPSEKRIYEYWSRHEGKELFDSYGIWIGDSGTCFACGWFKKVQRAHIVAVTSKKSKEIGSDNSENNIHLLCPNCHIESENLNEKYYWIWLKNKNKKYFKHTFKWTSEFTTCIELNEKKVAELVKQGDFYSAARLTTRHWEDWPNEDEIRKSADTLKRAYSSPPEPARKRTPK